MASQATAASFPPPPPLPPPLPPPHPHIPTASSSPASPPAQTASAIPLPDLPLPTTYFTESDVFNSPAYMQGIPPQKILKHRISTCHYIIKLGKRCGLPILTLATAQLLYHRYVLKYSFSEVRQDDLATTCLFVSGKIQDTIKKLKDLVIASDQLQNPGSEEMDPESEKMHQTRRNIIALEKLLLEAIEFNFQVQQPLIYTIKILKRFDHPPDMRRRALHICFDCYKTSLPLLYPPHFVAAASIFLASKSEKFHIPIIKGSSWLEKFGIEFKYVDEISKLILDEYLNIDGGMNEAESTHWRNIKIELLECSTQPSSKQLHSNAPYTATHYAYPPRPAKPWNVSSSNWSQQPMHHTHPYRPSAQPYPPQTGPQHGVLNQQPNYPSGPSSRPPYTHQPHPAHSSHSHQHMASNPQYHSQPNQPMTSHPPQSQHGNPYHPQGQAQPKYPPHGQQYPQHSSQSQSHMQHIPAQSFNYNAPPPHIQNHSHSQPGHLKRPYPGD
ncbi:cyclin-like protein [Paraphysoderma sedebokerense]|nr:cyclin-like protein [Paraphysoderma sedebokerense]